MNTNKQVSLLDKTGFFKSTKKLYSDTLVIDDCKLQQMIVSQLLNDLGLSSTCVDSITAALPYVSSLNQHKLIISDIELGDGLGIDLINIVRKHNKNNASIAISSNKKYRNAALNAGFDQFLCKPLEKEIFHEVLSSLISQFKSQHHTRRKTC